MRRKGRGQRIRYTALALSLTTLLSSLYGLFPGQANAAKEGTTDGNDVSVYMTTWDKSKLLHREPDAQFAEGGVLSPLTVNVDENRIYQTIEGFGAAMTGSSAYVMHHYLDKEAREDLLEKLFDPVKGAGFSYIRLTVGASDFSAESYSYNDLPEGQTDSELVHFSIAKDREYIIPVLKQALEIQPELKIMGTPWSAPGWMKTTGKLEKGKLLPQYYDAYARYFVKFIQAYEAEGIPVHAITVQNEPQYEPSDYPGMRMDAAEQADFVKNHLGPAFKAAGIETEIIGYDHNWDLPEYPLELLGDPEANAYLAGTAFHGYAGSVENQAQVYDHYPDKGIYFTESSGTYAYSVFGDNLNWDITNLIVGSTRNWAKTVLKWNLALDENHGPKIGGCADCRGVVTVHSDNGGITYNEEYYAFGHAAKFVRPGAVRIFSSALSSVGIENTAFRNSDGSKALIALNTRDVEQTIQVKWGEKSFSYALPAKAVVSFVWNGDQIGNPGINPYGRVEAEDFSIMNGMDKGIAEDVSGGQWVGTSDFSDNAGVLAFEDVDFTGGTSSVNLRYASEEGGRVELRLNSPDGTLIATGELEQTGGSQNWKTRSLAAEVSEGTDTLYVILKGKTRLNWLQFAYGSVKQTLNYMTLGGGFEEDGLTGWTGWTEEGQPSAQSVDTDGPRSGAFKLTHWQGQEFKQKTYRTVYVPNGTYTASVWVKKGDNIESNLFVEGHGGSSLLASAPDKYVGEWTRIEIPEIRVTSGQVDIGVYSESTSGDWAVFDDFELLPLVPKAPALPGAAGTPEAPESVTAEVYGDGFDVSLNWLPVDGAEGYAIYRSIVSDTKGTVTAGVYGDYSEIGLSPAEITSYRDSGLRGETSYYYRVAAFNSSGLSSVTAAVYATTAKGVDTSAPAAPLGLVAVEGIERVTLRWNHNLESDFEKYNIYVDGVRIASVSPVTESRYTVLNLNPGQSYSFAISAVDQAGNESQPSRSVTASPDASGVLIPFDNLDFESGSLLGWSEWHPEGQLTANSVDGDTPIGQYKLTHWAADNYQQSTYRTLRLPDGKYKVQVWIRTGGGQNALRLEVKNYGGTTLTKDLRGASGSTWTPFAIDDIRVSGGKMEIGIYSDAMAGNWTAIDNFQVYGYAPTAPTSVKAVGGDGEITLNWSRNTEYDLESYKVYRSGVPIKDGITGTSYTVTGLANGTEEEFQVSAVDKDGNESLPSAPVRAVPLIPVKLINGGFESGDTLGWSNWNLAGNAMYVNGSDTRTGAYKLTHWSDKDYMQTTYQMVELPNGTYRASVWVRADGGQNRMALEIKQHGNENMSIDLKPAASSDWTLFVSEPILVTTGKVEIGMFSDAKGGSWAAFDDVQIAGIASGGENKPPVETPKPEPTPSPSATISPSPKPEPTPSPSTTISPLPKPEPTSSSDASTSPSPAQSVVPSTAPSLPFNVSGDVAFLTDLALNERVGTNGITITEVMPDRDLILKAVKASVKELVLDLKLVSPAHMLEVSLPTSTLDAIHSDHPDLKITVSHNGGSYTLPVAALTEVLQQAGEEAIMKITIDQLFGERGNSVRQAVAHAGAQLVRTPIRYGLMLQKDRSVKELPSFGRSFVIQRLTVEGVSDTANLSAVTIGTDGELAFVPAMFERGADGVVYTVLKTNHNGVYTIVRIDPTRKAFKDTAGHWAEDSINVLASRFVVKGKNVDHFYPDEVLTRAEWVTLLVRAMGLQGTGTESARFSDVAPQSWFAGSISAAAEIGLIQGYTDGKFHPDVAVTREQIAVTLAQALSLDGMRSKNATQSKGGGFIDAVSISGWAATAVSLSTDGGLLVGTPNGEFRPQAPATRAEAAAVIERLIEMSNDSIIM